MKKTTAFIFLVSLFFMWGFLTSLNDILIPHLESAFQLKGWQAQLVQFFFFGAYFVMSIPSGWIIGKVGYKRGIIIGLILMGLGCLVFYPASIVKIYGFFLLGLFILASGVTLLQVAANPYVSELGSEETAASRLNLAQGVNSLGHTLSPLFGAWLILQNTEQVDVQTVQMPYLGIAITLFVLAIVFFMLELPKIKREENKALKIKSSVFDHPHLLLGAAAIFFYVGAESTIGGHLVKFFVQPEIGALDSKTAGAYVSFYWGGAMIGRFVGSIALSEFSKARKSFLMLMVPLLAFGIVEGMLWFNNLDLIIGIYFLGLLVINQLAFLLGAHSSARLIWLFALFAVILLLIGILGGGKLAMWAVIGVGLFNSIMWSNIFTLAIKGLKELTNKGSSLLVMMIVGGAIIPELQGLLRDAWTIQYSFIVPALCYLYLIFYGWKGHVIQEKEA